MIDISLHCLNKFYGENHVLQSISLDIASGEKVAILGKNGSGKTTLFNIITGNEYADSGTITVAPSQRVKMLSQIPVFKKNMSAEDVLRSAFKEINEINNTMKQLEGDEHSFKEYGRLLEELERLGAYEMEFKLNKICEGMKIDERLRKSKFCLLSEGEKSRINLTRILLRACDILLLDEPTNHLDLESLEWLENFLRSFKGTVLIISHDRDFLNHVIDRIIEIDNGKVQFYSGNYSFYVTEKERRLTSQSEQFERQQKEIKRIEERAKWLLEQNRFTTKHKAILSRIDHMEKIDRPKRTKKLSSEFKMAGHTSKEIFALRAAQKKYGNKSLFHNADVSIQKNDRIAIIGPNGAGKSSLLKIITGEEKLDSGEMKMSKTLKIAYLPQIVTFNNENASVLDTMRMEAGCTNERARSVLSKFLFHKEDVDKKVATLSGGEKSRFKLCILMQKEINFLILDEPTNHLDIAAREWIENVLMAFSGTLLFVSHDRYFLKKFADTIWIMENGQITTYNASFHEYLEMNRLANRMKVDKIKSARSAAKKRKKNMRNHPKALSMEDRILNAEEELCKLETEIEDEISKNEFSKMNDLYDKKNRLMDEINGLYEKWESGQE